MQNQNEANHESVSDQPDSGTAASLSDEQRQFAKVLGAPLAKKFYNRGQLQDVGVCKEHNRSGTVIMTQPD